MGINILKVVTQHPTPNTQRPTPKTHYPTPKKMAKEVLECSFCGRKKPETSLLIAGIDSHICEKCIEQAHGIVLEEIK